MLVYIDGLAPKKAHESDAAFDLFAQTDPEWGSKITLERGEWHVFDCGFAIAIPEGHVGLICPRSGLAAKRGLTVLNAPGIIDPDYRGNVGVILMNLGNTRAVINAGDRIAQLLIIPTTQTRVQLVQNKNALDDTPRGVGGFGSTGISKLPRDDHRGLSGKDA